MAADRELLDAIEEFPSGSWVAFSDNETGVIASGATVEQVLARAKQRGEERPIVFRVCAPRSEFSHRRLSCRD